VTSNRIYKPIVTVLRAAGPFCRAEKYHQDCWKKNADRYRFYRHNSRHDQYLQKVCGKDVAMNTVKSDMSDTYGQPDEREVKKAANTPSVQSDAGKWYGVGFQE
jgi:hypothetical protein